MQTHDALSIYSRRSVPVILRYGWVRAGGGTASANLYRTSWTTSTISRVVHGQAHCLSCIPATAYTATTTARTARDICVTRHFAAYAADFDVASTRAARFHRILHAPCAPALSGFWPLDIDNAIILYPAQAGVGGRTRRFGLTINTTRGAAFLIGRRRHAAWRGNISVSRQHLVDRAELRLICWRRNSLLGRADIKHCYLGSSTSTRAARRYGLHLYLATPTLVTTPLAARFFCTRLRAHAPHRARHCAATGDISASAPLAATAPASPPYDAAWRLLPPPYLRQRLWFDTHLHSSFARTRCAAAFCGHLLWRAVAVPSAAFAHLTRIHACIHGRLIFSTWFSKV